MDDQPIPQPIANYLLKGGWTPGHIIASAQEPRAVPVDHLSHPSVKYMQQAELVDQLLLFVLKGPVLIAFRSTHDDATATAVAYGVVVAHFHEIVRQDPPQWRISVLDGSDGFDVLFGTTLQDQKFPFSYTDTDGRRLIFSYAGAMHVVPSDAPDTRARSRSSSVAAVDDQLSDSEAAVFERTRRRCDEAEAREAALQEKVEKLKQIIKDGGPNAAQAQRQAKEHHAALEEVRKVKAQLKQAQAAEAQAKAQAAKLDQALHDTRRARSEADAHVVSLRGQLEATQHQAAEVQRRADAQAEAYRLSGSEAEEVAALRERLEAAHRQTDDVRRRAHAESEEARHEVVEALSRAASAESRQHQIERELEEARRQSRSIHSASPMPIRPNATQSGTRAGSGREPSPATASMPRDDDWTNSKHPALLQAARALSFAFDIPEFEVSNMLIGANSYAPGPCQDLVTIGTLIARYERHLDVKSPQEAVNWLETTVNHVAPRAPQSDNAHLRRTHAQILFESLQDFQDNGSTAAKRRFCRTMAAASGWLGLTTRMTNDMMALLQSPRDMADDVIAAYLSDPNSSDSKSSKSLFPVGLAKWAQYSDTDEHCEQTNDESPLCVETAQSQAPTAPALDEEEVARLTIRVSPSGIRTCRCGSRVAADELECKDTADTCKWSKARLAFAHQGVDPRMFAPVTTDARQPPRKQRNEEDLDAETKAETKARTAARSAESKARAHLVQLFKSALAKLKRQHAKEAKRRAKETEEEDALRVAAATAAGAQAIADANAAANATAEAARSAERAREEKRQQEADRVRHKVQEARAAADPPTQCSSISRNTKQPCKALPCAGTDACPEHLFGNDTAQAPCRSCRKPAVAGFELCKQHQGKEFQAAYDAARRKPPEPAEAPSESSAATPAVLRDQPAFQQGARAGPRPVALTTAALKDLSVRPKEELPKLVEAGCQPSYRKTQRRMLKTLIAELPEAYPNADLGLAIPQWISKRRQLKKWKWTTALTNATVIGGAMKRLHVLTTSSQAPVLGQAWTDAIKAMRTKALQEEEGAPTPATLHEVQQAVKKATERGHKDKAAALALGWLCAARLGCILQLKKENVSISSEGTMSVQFRRGKGVLLRGTAYTVPTSVPDEWTALLTSFLEESTGFLFPCDSVKQRYQRGDELKKLLREVNPALEQRSIRRGALQALAESGIEEETILLFSGHTSLKSLHRYLDYGRKRRLANEKGAAAMSKALQKGRQRHASQPSLPSASSGSSSAERAPSGASLV